MSMQSGKTIGVLLCWVTGLAGIVDADDSRWVEPYHQYRIPVEVMVEQSGWSVLSITEEEISSAIGRLEEYAFEPIFFAYNQLKMVEVDASGKLLRGSLRGGFCLVTDGRELAHQDPTQAIATVKNAYYLVRFLSEGGRFPPTVGYEQVFPVGEPPRNHAYMSSYVPRLLPKKRMRHECLLRSDGNDLQLSANDHLVGAREISVRRSRIALVADFKEAGRKRLVLYYQPSGAHYLKIPTLRRPTLPLHRATQVTVGAAEKRLGKTRYALRSNKAFDAWFADTTVKLTPATPVPGQHCASIQISTAANEAQSFQLILSPKSNFSFERVEVSVLRSMAHEIAAARMEVRAVEYVPVTRKARINQVAFFGRIGDPLIPVTPRTVTREDGNLAFWLTLRTPAGTPSGSYHGEVAMIAADGASMRLPLVVEVYDFELPEYSSFRTHMGGQYFSKNSGNAALKPIRSYHGVNRKVDLKRLARKYYDFMAREKFYPKNVALFVEVGMKWQPPPQGYGVDAPGNFFRLYDWEFEEFNETLSHFIDDLKVNSVCLTHTNPSVSHIFKHLPGDPRKSWNMDPGHVTMGWQTFRKMTQVTYDKKPGDPWLDTSVQVTRRQWDRLVLDYYREMGRNLDSHGWVDKFYVFIDETAGTDKILHLIRLLKSDPVTAKLRIAHCLQGFESLRHQDNGVYAFKDLITHVPQIDENYYRWEDYFWDDYEVPRERERLWSYAAYSSRLGINVPGMTNREVGLEVFHLGGSGYVIWDTLLWHHPYGQPDDPHNPWQEPYARLANGALCYFYPPLRQGFPDGPDFTITPSLRVMTYRESVDDYEYARLLEDLIAVGRRQGADVAAGEEVLGDIARMFPGSVEWTLNDAWYLELRDRMARAIVDLKRLVSAR
ncbi:MAG: hypothetical protein CMJ75_13500 [Planctomycetaceae bacterium]|nr:hypothetical protein [Planctomycetaceae bacterium]